MLVEILIPADVIAAWKKSKTLLAVMTLRVLLFGLTDPRDNTHFVGRLAPAGPRLLLEMMLPVLAPPVEVLIKMLPPAVVVEPIDEPEIVHPVMVLLEAPLMGRIRACAGGGRSGCVGNRERIAARVQTIDRHIVCAIEIDQRTAGSNRAVEGRRATSRWRHQTHV